MQEVGCSEVLALVRLEVVSQYFLIAPATVEVELQ